MDWSVCKRQAAEVVATKQTRKGCLFCVDLMGLKMPPLCGPQFINDVKGDGMSVSLRDIDRMRERASGRGRVRDCVCARVSVRPST